MHRIATFSVAVRWCASWSWIILSRRRWWRRRRRRWSFSKHLAHSISNSSSRIGFVVTAKSHVCFYSFLYSKLFLPSTNFISHSFWAQPTKPFPIKFFFHFTNIFLCAIFLQPTTLTLCQFNLHFSTLSVGKSRRINKKEFLGREKCYRVTRQQKWSFGVCTCVIYIHICMINTWIDKE